MTLPKTNQEGPLFIVDNPACVSRQARVLLNQRSGYYYPSFLFLVSYVKKFCWRPHGRLYGPCCWVLTRCPICWSTCP